jgi:hypothetical protein
MLPEQKTVDFSFGKVTRCGGFFFHRGGICHRTHRGSFIFLNRMMRNASKQEQFLFPANI